MKKSFLDVLGDRISRAIGIGSNRVRYALEMRIVNPTEQQTPWYGGPRSMRIDDLTADLAQRRASIFLSNVSALRYLTGHTIEVEVCVTKRVGSRTVRYRGKTNAAGGSVSGYTNWMRAGLFEREPKNLNLEQMA